MSTFFKSNAGPPRWVRKMMQAKMAAKHGFNGPHLRCSNGSPNLPLSSSSYLPPWATQFSNKTELSGPPHKFFTHQRSFGFEDKFNDSVFNERRPPFWLRNKWMTNNKYDSFGPPKSVIIEMLGLKRDYLNSKINSLDNHIAKLKEEITKNAESKKEK